MQNAKIFFDEIHSVLFVTVLNLTIIKFKLLLIIFSFLIAWVENFKKRTK